MSERTVNLKRQADHTSAALYYRWNRPKSNPVFGSKTGFFGGKCVKMLNNIKPQFIGEMSKNPSF